MKRPTPKRKLYHVCINGTPGRIEYVKGLSRRPGIIIVATAGRRSDTFTQDWKAKEFRDRTVKACQLLEGALVRDFIKAKCPELRDLFGNPTIKVEEVDQSNDNHN